jgi:hypothetical protein
MRSLILASVVALSCQPAYANTIRFDPNGAPAGVTFEACTAAGCVKGPVTGTPSRSEITAVTPRGEVSWVEAVGHGQRVISTPIGGRFGACAWDLDADGDVGITDFGILRRTPAMHSEFGAFRAVFGDHCG